MSIRILNNISHQSPLMRLVVLNQLWFSNRLAQKRFVQKIELNCMQMHQNFIFFSNLNTRRQIWHSHSVRSLATSVGDCSSKEPFFWCMKCTWSASLDLGWCPFVSDMLIHQPAIVSSCQFYATHPHSSGSKQTTSVHLMQMLGSDRHVIELRAN